MYNKTILLTKQKYFQIGVAQGLKVSAIPIKGIPTCHTMGPTWGHDHPSDCPLSSHTSKHIDVEFFFQCSAYFSIRSCLLEFVKVVIIYKRPCLLRCCVGIYTGVIFKCSCCLKPGNHMNTCSMVHSIIIKSNIVKSCEIQSSWIMK